jgi:tetratricopeptide (TPR) repeat protein
MSLAKEILDEVKMRYIYNQGDHFPLSIIKQFHIILWNLGVSCFKEKDFKSSLEWYVALTFLIINRYQYALELMPADDVINKSKTLRFISRTHLEMNQLEEALIAAKDSEQLDPTSFQTFYLLFSIYCHMQQAQEASNYLRKASDTEDFHADYFAVAAQGAYEVCQVTQN